MVVEDRQIAKESFRMPMRELDKRIARWAKMHDDDLAWAMKHPTMNHARSPASFQTSARIIMLLRTIKVRRLARAI